MPLGREAFLGKLASAFPKLAAQTTPYGNGLLHCEVAAFRQATEQAIDSGRDWEAELHFRFVEALLREADPELRNALEVSYLEDFALGECTPARYQAVKERMPKTLRAVLAGHHANWK